MVSANVFPAYCCLIKGEYVFGSTILVSSIISVTHTAFIDLSNVFYMPQ
uniref:Uncharacterized protein n=1 Tax=Arundo donax TaxID=35708 RepID=A0A0A9FN92_ARUDO